MEQLSSVPLNLFRWSPGELGEMGITGSLRGTASEGSGQPGGFGEGHCLSCSCFLNWR